MLEFIKNKKQKTPNKWEKKLGYYEFENNSSKWFILDVKRGDAGTPHSTMIYQRINPTNYIGNFEKTLQMFADVKIYGTTIDTNTLITPGVSGPSYIARIEDFCFSISSATKNVLHVLNHNNVLNLNKVPRNFKFLSKSICAAFAIEAEISHGVKMKVGNFGENSSYLYTDNDTDFAMFNFYFANNIATPSF